MLKTIYIFLIIVLFAHKQVLAQEPNSATKNAQKEYLSLKYALVTKMLEPELKIHPDNNQAKEMLADSYRRIREYDKALFWYAELTKVSPLKAEWALRYAEVLANKQQYTESENWYLKYLELIGTDNRASSFSQFYPEVGGLFINSKEWKINYVNINTAAAEYSPMYYKKGLIFTSSRDITGVVKRVFEWDQMPFTDMYYIEDLSQIKPVNLDSLNTTLRSHFKSKGKRPFRGNNDYTGTSSNDTKVLGTYNIKLAKDTLGDYLSDQIELKKIQGEVNTKYHDGPATLLPDGSIMFTRNNYNNGKERKSEEGITKLKIYTAKAPDWKTISSFMYNNDEYSVGDPAVNSKGTLLVFASDMPGGKGGIDLFYCKRKSVSDKWEHPINLGSKINTEGNELKPTFLNDSLLVFSSTGHPGLGGLDIFQVKLNGTEIIDVPINLGSPINSSYDDFGMIRSENGISGYFSSNRAGSDDIYSFNYHPFRIALHGIVLDSASNKPLVNGRVTITPAIKLQVSNNEFNAQLEKNTDYKITATADGYSTVTGLVSTKSIVSDTILNVVLKPSKNPILVPFNCDSVKEVLTINSIHYNFNKAFIREDAFETMARLLKLMEENPKLELLIASYCDSRGSSAYNVELSKRRSVSAMNYLINQGLDKNRVRIEYFGETHLLNNCADGVRCSEANQQLNRRSEFFLTLDGNKVLSMDCDWLEKAFSNM